MLAHEAGEFAERQLKTIRDLTTKHTKNFNDPKDG